ncbi:hypothetical protein A0J61_01236 [Choanephora cucurbitarum]|uniref:Uncharacterized protein n=1 Tax=Choanephora cucurbitarum TaxID=101091 RepID=A0A1C7NP13_9FUNG|nr:hypothetical protein A0J61_01236 [Choanephora cucurbitarum]
MLYWHIPKHCKLLHAILELDIQATVLCSPFWGEEGKLMELKKAKPISLPLHIQQEYACL